MPTAALLRPARRFDVPRILRAAASIAAVTLLLGAAQHAKQEKPVEISFGSPVKLADYLVPGKTTVFDFYSTYCPTCMALKPAIEQLHASRDDIAVVLVNINRPGFKGIDWDSPVSKQFELPSTPQ